MDSSLVDRISQLPEPVKHHVMSFLPYMYRVRTSILSKKWQNAMASYPVLNCYESMFEEGDVTEEDPTKERERKLRFMNMVDNSILKLYKSGMTLNGFNLKLVLPKFDDHDFCLRVDNWLEILVSKIKVKELFINFEGYYANFYEMSNRYRPHCILPQIIFGSKSLLTVLKLHNCAIEHLVFDACTKCESLQEVSLVNVSLSEEILRKILLCCSSSLIKLRLMDCSGVKNIRLSGLNKLNKVTVMDSDEERLERIEIEAPSLGSFQCCGWRTTIRVSLVDCVNLQELYIADPFVWEQFSDDIGSKYPLLKTLSISNCCRLRRFEISSLQLERLSLQNAKFVSEAIIKTPSLSSFAFDGNLSCISSFPTDTSRQCGTKLVMLNAHVTILWFRKLKKFLTKFGVHNVVVWITSISRKVMTFNWDDVRDITFPPPCHVKHLELHACSWIEGDKVESLLDGLLWSCRPETLSIEPFEENFIDFAMVLCEKFLSQNNRENCCGSCSVACWVHYVKDVKIALFVGSDEEALDCQSLSQALPTLTKGDKISFKFIW